MFSMVLPGKTAHPIVSLPRKEDLWMNSNEPNVPAELFPSIATQLRAALGNIHFAAAALAPAEARERDPKIDASAALFDQGYYRLLRIVDNLTAAEYLSRETVASPVDQDIVAAVSDLCAQSASLAGLMKLRLTFSSQEKSHVCAFHKNLLEQLLFQLLSNAFKFTPAGGSIAVDLRFSGGQVLLSVADTGCGISEELLPSLFDRYLHSDLMNPPPHGLGLGLSLCRRIAEQHGGNMMAESKVGEGTRITLSIPDRQTDRVAVSDMPFDYTGGFNHTLLALSDALPPQAFRLKEQD